MKVGLIAVLAILVAVPRRLPAQAHDRREAAIAESSAVHGVEGGTTIQIAASYDRVFDALVTYLQKAGYSIDSASKESGLIATSMEISGGWKQTGKRILISVIRDGADNTSARVAATTQKRYKGLQAEPWGDPTVDEKTSATTAQKIHLELPAALGHSS